MTKRGLNRNPERNLSRSQFYDQNMRIRRRCECDGRHSWNIAGGSRLSLTPRSLAVAPFGPNSYQSRTVESRYTAENTQLFLICESRGNTRGPRFMMTLVNLNKKITNNLCWFWVHMKALTPLYQMRYDSLLYFSKWLCGKPKY